ncbi:MAG TPA: oligosaccharide flippase family protein [Oculatellaceae cyanobacterium]|nr:oligosaccharide flippase family protein [Anaerolineales bacterium]
MNKYLRAISSNFIYFIINTIFFVLIIPLAIKILGEVFFGLWSVLYALMLVANIGTLGIGSIVSKFAAEAHTEHLSDEQAFGEVITAGLLIVLPMAVILMLAFIVSRQWIAQTVTPGSEWETQFSRALLYVGLSMFPTFLSQVFQGFLLSQLQNRVARQIEVFSSIALWTGVVLSVSLFGRNLILVGIWCLITSAGVLVLYYLAARHQTKFRLCLCPARLRTMLSFSGYMFLESGAVVLLQNVDRVIVGFTLGPAIAGVYSVGTSVGLRMSMVIGQATQVMIPYASLKDSTADHLRLYIIFRKLSQYVSLFVAVLGSLLILWMNEILALWISPAYAVSYSNIFRILIIGYGWLSLVRPAHQTLTGLGKVRITSLIYSFSTLSMLASLYLLTYSWGLLGAALANCVPVLLLAMNLYIYKRADDRAALQGMFSDLKEGLFIPALALLLVLLYPAFWLKLLLTIALGCFTGVMLFHDEWLRDQIRRVTNRFLTYA